MKIMNPDEIIFTYQWVIRSFKWSDFIQAFVDIHFVSFLFNSFSTWKIKESYPIIGVAVCLRFGFIYIICNANIIHKECFLGRKITKSSEL